MFFSFILGFVIISVIIILTVLAYIIIDFINKKKFEKRYNIKLKSDFKVEINEIYNDINRFELNFPKWNYSNKDGSRNKVRNNNYLVYDYSVLYFEGFILKTKSPVQMIDLIKELRNKYDEISIEKNEIEEEKYIELIRKKDLINKSNEIQNIIDEFKDNPTKFEIFCAELYKKIGYEAEVTPKTNDGGYDIILNNGIEKSIIECKCYSQNHSVGRPMIQKLVGANQEAKADNLKFITTSKFSKEAIIFAKETNVELINGKKLIELINKYYEKCNNIVVSREEWELNYEDLEKLYPPDVNVLDY